MSESKTATKAVTNNPPPPAPAQAKPSGPVESKSSRFKRLAVKRTARAIKTIGYVANLSSTSSYEYTPEQAEKIVEALTNAVANVKQRFSGVKQASESFTL